MLTLGSLFSGAGGFEFAGQLNGIEPLWASEIEEFPIAVTTKRFPNMKHLGDVTKINGAEIDPVDIITFGSPCQDLSVAGKRAGLKHEEKGDEETTRSGLFMEAIRIIKEMRTATNGKYPSLCIWENVPGAFSSNSAEDFRIVLESICRIEDETADIPRPPKGKWAYSGEIVGDGYSVAWRVLDPRKCVPQRRRRIFLVADFTGLGAGKILFEREGLSRDFAESREAWQGITASLAFGSDDESVSRKNCYGICSADSNSMKSGNPHSGIYEADTARCLDANGGNPSCNQGGIAVVAIEGNGSRPSHQGNGYSDEGLGYTLNSVEQHGVCYAVENHPMDSRINLSEDGIVQTLPTRMGTGGNNVPLVCSVVVDQGAGKSACNVTVESSPTLACTHDGAPVVCYSKGTRPHSKDEAQKWHESDTANTLNSFDTGEERTNEIVLCGELGVASRDGGHIYTDGYAPTLKAKPGDNLPTVLCVRERAGCEGGGKGLLVQEGVSGNSPAHADQFLCYATVNGEAAATIDANYFKGCGEREGTEREVVCLARCLCNGQGHQLGLSEEVGALNCMHDSQALLTIGYEGTSFGARSETEVLGPITTGNTHIRGDTPIVGCIAVDADRADCAVCETDFKGIRNQDIAQGKYVITLDRAAYNQGANAQFDMGISDGGIAYAAIAKGPGAVCYCMGSQQGNTSVGEDICPTITTMAGLSGNNQPVLCRAVDCRNNAIDEVNGTLQAKPNGGISYNLNNVVLNLNEGDVQSKTILDPAGIAPAIYAGECRGGGGELYVLVVNEDGKPKAYAFKYLEGAKARSIAWDGDTAPTISAEQTDAAVLYLTPIQIVLRRLTPTECGRLQGMPDWWCNDVPHSDSAEYKMWGNGMALPCVLYVMEGCAAYLRQKQLKELFA